MPPPTYRFHPHAVAEAEEARDWYAQRSPRAALDFLKELDRVIDSVLDAPERWPESADGDRRYVLQRFPFLLVYSYVDNVVEFVAVAHGRRRPLLLDEQAMMRRGAHNMSQQLSDRSCHGGCLRNARANSASPDVPAAEALRR